MAEYQGTSSFKSYIKPDISVNPAEGILINFDDETTDNPQHSQLSDDAEQAGGLVQMSAKNCKQTEKLCGYLSKLGARGIVKSYKRRWFVYSDSSCKLLYYRTPEDIVALGEIDIEHATFSMPEVEGEKPGKFDIRFVNVIATPPTRGHNFWLRIINTKTESKIISTTIAL